MNASPAAAPQRRARRILTRIAVIGAVLVVCALGALFIVLGNLDSARVKQRVVAQVKSASGFELDYRTFKLSLFSGAELEDVVILNPPSLRTVAPELARLKSLTVKWTLGSTFRIDQITANDVTVGLVFDDTGTTSLSTPPASSSHASSAAEPAVGLSVQLSQLMRSAAPPIGRVELADVSVSVFETAEQQRVNQRLSIAGLNLVATTEPDTQGWKAQLQLGESSAPLKLIVERDGAKVREAKARLDCALGAELSPTGAHVSIDAKLHSQSFAPDVNVEQLIHSRIAARFEPEHKRIAVVVEPTQLANAATFEAALVLPDDSRVAPTLNRASLDVDLARGLSLVSRELLPLAVETGSLRVRAQEVSLGELPTLGAQGSLEVNAEASQVTHTAARTQIDATAVKIGLTASPGKGGQTVDARLKVALDELQVRGPTSLQLPVAHLELHGEQLKPRVGGTLPVDGSVSIAATLNRLLFVQGTTRLSLGETTLDANTQPDASTDTFALKLGLALEALDLRGPTTLRIPTGRLELTGNRVKAAPESPAGIEGDLTLTTSVPSLSSESGQMRISAEQVGLIVRAPLSAHPPLAMQAELPVKRLRVVDESARSLLDAPVHLQLAVADVVSMLAKAQLQADVGALHAELDASKRNDSLDYTLKLDTKSLGVATPFMSPSLLSRAPWNELALSLQSTGTISDLNAAAPKIDHHSTLKLPRLMWDRVSARDVVVGLRSKGNEWKHDGALDVQLEQLRVGDAEFGSQHVSLTLAADRRRPSLKLMLTTPAVSLDATVAYESARKALHCDVNGSLHDLDTAAPFLAVLQIPTGIDASRLKATFALRGDVLGLLEQLTPNGDAQVVADPLETVGFEGTSSFEVNGFRWHEVGQGVVAPAVRWKAELHTEGRRRTVHSVLDVDRLVLIMGERRIIGTKLSHDVTASIDGRLDRGAVTVSNTLTTATLEQRPALPWLLKNVTLSFAANRDASGIIHVSDAQFASPETHTRLSMKGTLDLSHQRRQLAIRGTLKQELSALAMPEVFEGKGDVEVSFRVASPDLNVYRTRSKVRLHEVHVSLPASGFSIEGFDGEVSVKENIGLADGSFKLLQEIDTNPYSMLRFADQHPLLANSGYISIAKISSSVGEIAPLAGNLTIDQNVVSLSQLELGVRGGRMTGQCTLDLHGRDSTLEAHVRATGVQSSRGEPFDGNAALVISAHDRSIDGRLEVLRIGNRHLLDLLDVQDPQHLDGSLNRVRAALGLGYPQHLRLVFNRGFASMRITFGGLARLLTIDDVRGIPVGPLVGRALSSFEFPE